MRNPPLRVLPVVLTAAALLAVFLPSLTAEYGLTDDYTYLQTARHAPADLLEAGVCMGRPISGALWLAAFPMAGGVGDLAGIRAAGMAFLWVFILSAFAVIRKNTRLGDIQAGAFALAVGLTPAFLIQAAWATCFPFPLAAALGLWAGHLAANMAPESSRAAMVRRALAALVMLTSAYLVYQPAAMFFWFAPTLRLLAAPTPARGAVVFLLRCGAVAACALAAGLLIFKLGNALYDIKNGSRGGLTLDPAGKITWFLRRPLRHVFAPWALEPRVVLVLPALALVTLGLWLGERQSPRRALARMLLAGALICLAYLPNLVVRENWSSFRTMAAPAGVGIAVGWAALRGFAARFPALTRLANPLALLVAAACIAAGRHHVSAYVARPQAAEWAFVRDSVGRFLQDGRPLGRIVLVRPEFRESLAPGVFYDEFGIPSSFPPWVPEPLVMEAFQAHGSANPDVVIEVVDTPPASPPPEARILDVGGFIAGGMDRPDR